MQVIVYWILCQLIHQIIDPHNFVLVPSKWENDYKDDPLDPDWLKPLNETNFYDIFTSIKQTGFASRYILHSTNIERTLPSAMALITSMFKHLACNDSNGLSPLTVEQPNYISNNIDDTKN